MRLQWLCGARVVAFALGVTICAVCGACEPEEEELFAPGTFSGTNESAIVLDCDRTVRCLSQRLGAGGIPSDPFGICQRETAKHLHANAGQQQRYLQNVNRCQHHHGCTYFDCASNGGESFGQTQVAHVTLDCEQALACKDQQMVPIADRQYELSNCINNRVLVLNGLGPEEQNSYLESVASCAGRTGCDYNDNCIWPRVPVQQ